MPALARKDFASLLDDLVAARDDVVESVAPMLAPSIPFDYLAVAEELHSGRVTVAEDVLRDEYAETSGEEFAAFLVDAADLAANEEALEEAALSVDPNDIATELDLDQPEPDYGQIRRRFAFANHPDRVAPLLRDSALLRMQIANMLIDAAERAITSS